ncbi:MAG TPA: M14 family zinc carboxypeptidase [Actinomycetota bacterium]|nr:M14 family zinc carboxypeptidase [Actinomycetota bacterium]
MSRRRTLVSIFAAAFLIGALVGPATAHYRRANGNRVTKKHARMHQQDQTGAQAAESGSAELPAAGAVAGGGGLQMYESTVDGQTLQDLVTAGYDVTPVDSTVDGTRVALVLSPSERDQLQGKGLGLTLWRGSSGQTAARMAALQAENGFQVWRSYDEPGGIEDELREIGSNPVYQGFLKLYDIGDTHQGRDILAIRMTQGARGLPLGRRPAVLYQGTTHAREWISTEVAMRLLNWFIDERRAENPEVVNLLETREVWFLPVVNPDGYQYTFDEERLWRKNLRDNNGDGDITIGDGVDLNRNYPEHWNYDTEGSNSQFPSDTYRGPAPASEPESSADINLIERMGDFRFAISYHSFGQLLLYTQGWQTLTPSADDPIYVALTGTDDDPAVEGFNPGVGADLYTTNGEFTDWAHAEANVLAWTPELSDHGGGFIFPDDEALVQEEFEKNLEFSLNVARSALDPDDPASHAAIDTAGLYVDVSEIDPWKTNWPTSDLSVDISYAGDSSQPVEVLAKRAVGAVTLNYTINGTPGSGPTSESANGERYGGNNAYDTYYHFLQGAIPGLVVGDHVEYWFTAGGESTDPVSFDVVEDSDDADVLILAAEDRTGASQFPNYASTSPSTPNYLSFYEDALAANGIDYDVYDVDAQGRVAPDHLGVLGHYDAVVWYRGNDIHVREPGWGGGNVSRLAVDETLEIRQYMNEGGRVLYTGQWAGGTENGVGGNQLYDPVANQRCQPPASPEVAARCLNWGDKNDFLQYYLGAYLWIAGAGFDENGNPFPIVGAGEPFDGPPASEFTLGGGTSADNIGNNASLIATSGILDPETYPQFDSWVSSRWDRPGGPFSPHTGDFYAYSQIADITYKRLARTITVPAGGATMSFWTSYDTEASWDHVFVEAHTVGQDNWTTLPDLNGHTTQATGDSCQAQNSGGWRTLHPHLDHYQTQVGTTACNPTGTTGAWHAASGNSGGWQQWQVDLGGFAGQQVEVSISYASDWSVQGLGTFVDDIEVSTGEGTTSFETGMDGWTVAGAPEGSAANFNDWIRTTAAGFPEGSSVSTEDSIYTGFGFEQITEEADRNEVMGRAIDHFLGP